MVVVLAITALTASVLEPLLPALLVSSSFETRLWSELYLQSNQSNALTPWMLCMFEWRTRIPRHRRGSFIWVSHLDTAADPKAQGYPIPPAAKLLYALVLLPDAALASNSPCKQKHVAFRHEWNKSHEYPLAMNDWWLSI